MQLRIGGVPEHFNLPWRLAIEEGAFAQLGYDATWTDYPGGTGQIMAALADGSVDLATPLTEGAIKAIHAGNPARIERVWVDSPLLWGIHVASASPVDTVADAEGRRFAISRFGSGSELMTRVMADELGWTVDHEDWIVVGGLAGALEALPAGEADVFLWNKSMTQPHVDDGTFRRVGVYPTAWPSFVVASSGAFDASVDADVVSVLIDTAAHRAAAFARSDDGPLLVADRYDLGLDEAKAWFDHVRFTVPGMPLDPTLVETVEAKIF